MLFNLRASAVSVTCPAAVILASISQMSWFRRAAVSLTSLLRPPPKESTTLMEQGADLACLSTFQLQMTESSKPAGC